MSTEKMPRIYLELKLRMSQKDKDTLERDLFTQEITGLDIENLEPLLDSVQTIQRICLINIIRHIPELRSGTLGLKNSVEH